MKKVLSLILALLMTASSASAILADEAIVDEAIEETAIIEEEEEVAASPYDRAIEFLYNYGIYKGKSADDLAAYDLIERYQMALFTARLATGWVDDDVWEDGPEDWSEFKDLDEGPASNYLGAISYANQMGIVEGYGNGKFGPTDAITYQNALTMIVRTLGYQGLEWPWGYIAQAVKLGLTDGIVDVAYTDELTRGEVAQIIYNALFATAKDGTTLALKSFGIEFGWEKVIITASDLNTFVQDKTGASKGRKDNNAYVTFNGSNKPSATFVTFQILNDDGTLADDVYYAKAEAFGLSSDKYAHDDEAVVGDAYYVLFEKDADSDLVEIVTYESLYVDTLWNLGKTDDEGVAQTYPIETFKTEYALVDKYTGASYINVTASRKPEILLYTANSYMTVEKIDGNMIAIDWETGDIKVPVTDSNEKDGYAKDDKGNILYEVAWYYNSLLERYYQFQRTSDGEVIAINWMSDAEFEEFYKKYEVKSTLQTAGFANITTSIAKTAYASIELFDTNLDGVVDRGIYESYKFGKFSPTTYCDTCKRSAYKIENCNPYAVAAATADGSNISDTYAFTTIVEGQSCSHNTDRAWFVEGYEPMTDKDGAYVACYVIYSYDTETGAIKVVKVIDDGTDKDSFVATGVVRAYNASKETITIGDTQYTCNYDELAGTGFYIVNKNTNTKAAYTTFLRGLFNQYVEYVVVDGEVVFVKKLNATTSELIVVDSYAGISSDGYIVINGYSTSALKLDRFRIGSYDGNIKGDPFYYMTDALAKAAFTKGAIYAISSYDKTEDIYYVQLIGELNDDYIYTVDTKSGYAALTHVTIKENGDGYMTYTTRSAAGKDTASEKKMKSDDKYIIITSALSTFQSAYAEYYAPIIVYEGKLPEGWAVEGDELGSTGDNTYVIVNAKVIKGFKDTYKTGLVLLLNKNNVSMNFSGADSEGWYLLGATETEVEVFDLFTGNEDNVILRGTNIDLTKGHVYTTNDGVIVEDLGTMMYADTFVEAAQYAYLDSDTYYAGYISGTNFVGSDYYSTTLATAKEKIEKGLLVGSDIAKVNSEYAKFRGDKVSNTIKYMIVTYNYDSNKNIESIAKIESKTAAQIATYIKNGNYTKMHVGFIYNVSSHDIVFYLFPTELASDKTVVTTTTDGTKGTIKVKEFYGLDDKQVVATLYADVDYVNLLENNVIVGQQINGVKLYFTLADENTNHANIKKYNWHFGLADQDFLENYIVACSTKVESKDATGKIVTTKNTTTILSSIVASEYPAYDDHDEDCENCELVQSIYLKFSKPIVTEIFEYNTDGTIKSYADFELLITIGDAEPYLDSVDDIFDVIPENLTDLNVWLRIKNTNLDSKGNPAKEISFELGKLAWWDPTIVPGDDVDVFFDFGYNRPDSGNNNDRPGGGNNNPGGGHGHGGGR